MSNKQKERIINRAMGFDPPEQHTAMFHFIQAVCVVIITGLVVLMSPVMNRLLIGK